MGYKPKEKDIYMPWSTVTSLWNPKTQTYENVDPAQKKPFEEPAISNGLPRGGIQASQPKKRKLNGLKWDTRQPSPKKSRRKNAGLPADAPSVMFPGLPLAVAMRKKEALEKRYPNLSGAELLAKQRQLDAAKTQDETKRDEPVAQKATATSPATASPREKRENGTAAANKVASAAHILKPGEDPIARMVAAAPKRVIRKVTVKVNGDQGGKGSFH